MDIGYTQCIHAVSFPDCPERQREEIRGHGERERERVCVGLELREGERERERGREIDMHRRGGGGGGSWYQDTEKQGREREKEKGAGGGRGAGSWRKRGIRLTESIQRRGRRVPSALDIPSFLLLGCHTRLDSEGPTPRPPQTPWGNRYVWLPYITSSPLKKIQRSASLPLVTGLRFHWDAADIAIFPWLQALSYQQLVFCLTEPSRLQLIVGGRTGWRHDTMQLFTNRGAIVVGHRKSYCMKACLSVFYFFLFFSLSQCFLV